MPFVPVTKQRKQFRDSEAGFRLIKEQIFVDASRDRNMNKTLLL